MNSTNRVRWTCCCLAALMVTVRALGGEVLVVADMEGPTEYRGFPFKQANSPRTALTTATASEGKRSLRFDPAQCAVDPLHGICDTFL